MRMNTTAACLLAALCVTGSAARADALQSVYSDLSLKACAHGANRSPSKRDDHEAVTYRCMGPAGIVISVRYEGTHVNVVFQGGGLAAAEKVLRAEYSVGEKLEWRGRQGIKGFEAAAGILAIARNVSVPFGAPYKGFGIYNTEYRTAANLTAKRYYFELTNTPNVIWADLDAMNLDAGQPVRALDPNSLDLSGNVMADFRVVPAPF